MKLTFEMLNQFGNEFNVIHHDVPIIVFAPMKCHPELVSGSIVYSMLKKQLIPPSDFKAYLKSGTLFCFRTRKTRKVKKT